jgi:hypothetical protein
MIIVVDPLLRSAISTIVEIDIPTKSYVDLFVGFVVCACAGFGATWVHRGSAMPLAAIGTIVIGLMVTAQGNQSPYWYQIAFVVIALFAPIVGGAAFVRRTHRSRNS